MSDVKVSFSLIDLKGLSPVAEKIVDKISGAIGLVAKPLLREREARAEMRIASLEQRAAHQRQFEDTKFQANMEKITAQAIGIAGENAKPESVEDDWLTHFYQKSRILSDAEMQSLWARILAGELQAPGSFSKRTLESVATMDKSDAQSFTRFCGYTWNIGGPTPVILDNADHAIYGKSGIGFGVLNHLTSIGLLTFSALGFIKRGLPKYGIFPYFGIPYLSEFPNEKDNQLKVGNFLFSKTGEELCAIAGAKPVPGFPEFLMDRWNLKLWDGKNPVTGVPMVIPPGS